MAKRFGGEFSPGDDPNHDAEQEPFDLARVDPVGTRANVLFIPAIPLLFFAFNDGAIGLTLALIAGGALTLAAWLLRQGLRAEAAFHSRRIARRPAFPRKMAASLLTGVGVAIAAFKTELSLDVIAPDPGMIAPVLYGVIATVLHSVAFGIDPLKDKGMEGIDTFQQNRVDRAVKEGEAYLNAMTDAILRAGDRQIEARVEMFQSTARTLFRTVKEDPRDLSGARKYLTIYLMGARDASIKFADLYSRGPDPQARTDYLALLDDLETNFAARTEKMLLDDRSDLNIEIEVLRERLQREGLRSK